MDNMTKAEAIQILVDSECARWGEQEREAAQRLHNRRTLGLAMNEVANRLELDAWREFMPIGMDSDRMRKHAKKVMTTEDRAFLRRGG